MADRYLLESGAPDGYLLEDGSGVLLLEGPLPGDSGGDDWWAGAQRCFVGVAIAGAAAFASQAALAQRVATQDQADIVAPPSMGGNVTKDPARVLRWHVGDDFAPVAASPLFDDEPGTMPVASPAPLVLRVFSADDEIVPQPVALPVDELFEWKAPVVLPAGPYSWQWQPNEDIVPQPAPSPAFDEDFWQRPFVIVEPLKLTLWQVEDERPTPAVPTESDAPDFAPRSDWVSVTVWVENEEPPQQVTTPTGGSILREPARVLFWNVGEDIVTAPAGLGVDEVYHWQAPRPIAAAAAQLFAADDDIVSMPEPDDWQIAVPAAPSAFVRLWSDQDETPTTPPTFAPPEEDAPVFLTAAQEATWVIWATEEDPPLHPQFDEDHWQAPFFAPVPPPPFVATDDGSWVPPPVPLPISEDSDYWFGGPVLVPPIVTVWGPDGNEDAIQLSAPEPVVLADAAKWPKKKRQRFLWFEEEPQYERALPPVVKVAPPPLEVVVLAPEQTQAPEAFKRATLAEAIASGFRPPMPLFAGAASPVAQSADAALQDAIERERLAAIEEHNRAAMAAAALLLLSM